MAKMKIQDVTKELSQKSAKLHENVSHVKLQAEKLLSDLKKIENGFVQKEEAAREEKRREEQMRAMQSHSKAWTMPDEPIEEKTPVTETASVTNKASVPSDKPVTKTEKVENTAQVPQPSTRQQQGTVASAKSQQNPAPVARPAGQTQQNPAVASHPAASAPQSQTAVARAAGPASQNQTALVRPAGQNQQGQTPAARPVGQSGPRTAPAAGQGRPPIQQNRTAGAGQSQSKPVQPSRQQGQGNARSMAGNVGAQKPFDRNNQRNQGNAGRNQGMQPGRANNRPRLNKEPELLPTVEKERVSNYDPNKKTRQRQHDPEFQNTKNRKQLARENGYNGLDDEIIRGRRKKGKQSAQQKMAPIKIETAFMTAETITVRDLTERIGKPAGEIIKKLMLLGIMATINQELDFDTASLVASEFGVTLEMKLDKTAEDALSAENVVDTEEDLLPRPPVVTVMGHVDHGKTSLLDYIRKTKVTAGEAGGITQHIGAYTAQVNGRQITFLDTPGHEAFTAMRARGTQATDIAILVVAADDGVMPQTIESIHHAKAAKCPIVVAINKIDKPGADPEIVKQGLTQYELIPEEWGGDTIMVPVSAKTGEGIDDLLENVLLVADMLELRANPNRKARGVIIEAKLDHSRGAIATALVQNGTLHVGDMVVAGAAYGRVRAMVSSRGDRVKTALPSTPVEIVGFGDVPEAGDEFIAVEDEKLARQVVEERAAKVRASMVKNSSASTLEELYSKLAEGEVKDLNIIIKADVQGSVEAVKQSLEKLSNDKVHVRTIHSGVGGVTENDVMLAGIDGAIIIGFNVRPDGKAREAAARDGIDIRYYRVIYQAIEDIEKAMKGLLSPEFKENLLGHAEVRNVFKITGVGTIAGCYVTDGKIQRNAQVRLLRDNVVIFEGKLSSLQRFKDSVREVADGYECGVGLENYADIKNGDVVECFLMEEIKQ